MKAKIKNLTIKFYFHMFVGLTGFYGIFFSMLPTYAPTTETFLTLIITAYAFAATCRYERLLYKTKLKMHQMMAEEHIVR